MNEQQRLDFLSAFGEEFSDALSSSVDPDYITPQDSYEMFLKAFGTEPTPTMISSLSERQIEEFRSTCQQYFGGDKIATAQIRTIFARTLARWS